MMNNVHILTNDEYEELLQQKNEPDTILRETNLQLKQKIELLEKQCRDGSFEQTSINSPILINDEVLSTAGIGDFVQMYNFLAVDYSCSTLKQSDKKMFDYLEQMANMFMCQPYFQSVSDVKKYRVNLQKKTLYTNVKRNGVIHLIKDSI